MNTLEVLSIPLSKTVHEQAKQFAGQQVTPEKGLQVYLNTLAVWTVHRYLQFLHIDTDLSQSESWNVALQALGDSADLLIPSQGKLECRWVQGGQRELILPQTLTGERLGVVVVRLGDNLHQGEILGFVPTHWGMPERVKLSELRSLDILLETLDSPPVVLTNWLMPRNLKQGLQEGWETLENLLTPQTPTFAFRKSSVSCAKTLEFESPLLLILGVISESESRLLIEIQVCPVAEKEGLASTVLQVITETGEVFKELVSSPEEQGLQYQFSGEFGEKFTINIKQNHQEQAIQFKI